MSKVLSETADERSSRVKITIFSGECVMRCVGLMAILLLFAACKPVARGPVSELEAVSDGNLTLGMVPVENDEGAQAYRLLVCRKSASYPQWMLEDSNRCRSALLDQEDNEVVFIHSELERDFATKYTDYASGYAAPALIGIGATAAALGGGAFAIRKVGFVKNKVANPIGKAWKKVFGHGKGTDDYERGWRIFDNTVVNTVTGAPANIAARLPNYVIVAKTRLFFLRKLSKSNAKVMKLLRLNKTNLDKAIAEQEAILVDTYALHRLKMEESLLRGLKRAADKGDDAKQKYLDKIGAELDEMTADTKNYTEGDLDKIIGSGTDAGAFKMIENGNRVGALKKVVKKEGDKFTTALEDVPERLDALTARAKRGETPPAGSIQEASRRLFDNKVDRTYTPFGVSRKALSRATLGGTAAGAAGIAVVTMTDLDKSVWGYGDRQTSAHFSQVFSQSMQSENRVKDLPRLLEEFAEFFGHRVNPAALALGN